MAHMQPPITHQLRYLAHAAQMAARFARADVKRDISLLVVAGMNHVRSSLRAERMIAAKYLDTKAPLPQRTRNDVSRLYRRRLARRHCGSRNQCVQPGYIQPGPSALDAIHEARPCAAHVQYGRSASPRKHRVA